MSPQKRAAYLKKAALKAARKAIKRRNGEPLTREELLELRVPTAPLWLRILFVVLGGGIIFGGIVVCATTRFAELGVLAAVIGIALAAYGFGGRRRSVGTCLESLGDGLAELVIQAIVSALD